MVGCSTCGISNISVGCFSWCGPSRGYQADGYGDVMRVEMSCAYMSLQQRLGKRICELMKRDSVKQNPSTPPVRSSSSGSSSGGVNLTTIGMTSTQPGRNHSSSALCGELGAPSQKQTASHRCFPSLSIHPPASHLTAETRTSREKKASWQWIWALLGSAEQLCLIKSLASKINGALHNNPAEETSKKSGDE